MPDTYSVQRLRGRFALVWTDEEGKRHRHALAAPDRIGAQAEARQRWRLGDRGQWTVGRIVEAYLEDRRRAGIESYDRRRNAWKAMRGFWADVSPRLIDDEMAQGYAAMRARAPATVRYELSMLSVALRWAVKAKLIETAPDIWLPAAPERRERHLSRAQFRRFLEGVVAPHARLYMILGLATLSRPTALLQLRWPQVDFERGLIDLNPPGRGQTRKRRPVVPIADWARPALEEAWALRQSDFVIERGGRGISCIKKAFAAASQRSGVHATPYTLRHTGAVWRAEDGVPMTEIAQLMGHDDDRTTQKHYARFSPDYLRGAANAGRW